MPVITLRNPSDYPRAGHVAMRWKELHDATGISPRSLVLRNGSAEPLLCQVDPVDPADPGRAELAFILPAPVAPGSDDYGQVSGTLELDEGAPPDAGGPVAERQPTGFNLRNGVLDVYVSLGAHDGLPYFAGAASSVVLNGKLEMLDAIISFLDADPREHEREKRCMQVDRLQLARPAWEQGLPLQEEWFCERPYELVHASSGPVRASATLRSAPFHYDYTDPLTRRAHRLVARFERVLHLYRGADYVIESLRVPAAPEDGGPGAPGCDLTFSARYFALMNMGHRRKLTHFRHIPDWFTLSYEPDEPLHGYGFATDVHAGPVVNPFPTARPHLSYSWELGPGTAATCLHLFRCGPHQDLVDQTGRAWYDHVYKPLRATVTPQGAPHARRG